MPESIDQLQPGEILDNNQLCRLYSGVLLKVVCEGLIKLMGEKIR